MPEADADVRLLLCPRPHVRRTALDGL